MNDFDFSFMILRRVNEKCDEFWMKNSEKLVKIVPFIGKMRIEALMYRNNCY